LLLRRIVILVAKGGKKKNADTKSNNKRRPAEAVFQPVEKKQKKEPVPIFPPSRPPSPNPPLLSSSALLPSLNSARAVPRDVAYTSLSWKFAPAYHVTVDAGRFLSNHVPDSIGQHTSEPIKTFTTERVKTITHNLGKVCTHWDSLGLQREGIVGAIEDQDSSLRGMLEKGDNFAWYQDSERFAVSLHFCFRSLIVSQDVSSG